MPLDWLGIILYIIIYENCFIPLSQGSCLYLYDIYVDIFICSILDMNMNIYAYNGNNVHITYVSLSTSNLLVVFLGSHSAHFGACFCHIIYEYMTLFSLDVVNTGRIANSIMLVRMFDNIIIVPMLHSDASMPRALRVMCHSIDIDFFFGRLRQLSRSAQLASNKYD